MKHLKGFRFDCGFVQRISHIEDKTSHRITWNVHDGCEVHYVLKGNNTWETAADKSRVNVAGGSFIVIPPKVQHRAADALGSPSERIGIIYNNRRAAKDGRFALNRRDLNRIFSRLNSHGFVPRPIPPELKHTLRDIRKALVKFDPNESDSLLRLRLLNEQLIFQTYETLGCDTIFDRKDNVIDAVCKWIVGHLSERISIEAIVNRSGYSRSRLFDLFLAETGMTPKDYVVRARLDAARSMLKNKRNKATSISKIARNCGFMSAVNFSIAFRRHYGKSPSEFRRALL